MALYHFHVTQVKRTEGLSAVASAAYRAGEKITNLWDGETHDYTRKGGVVCTEIMLPPNAPERFYDRATLWNELELFEKRGDAQLAYSFDASLQNEFTLEENIEYLGSFRLEERSKLCRPNAETNRVVFYEPERAREKTDFTNTVTQMPIKRDVPFILLI